MTLSVREALRSAGLAADEFDVADASLSLPPLWLRPIWPSWAAAMTLPGRVYATPAALERMAAGEDPRLIGHEAVHLAQWKRHGAVKFATRYLVEYVAGRAVGLPHRVAYRSISFETEAEALAGGSQGDR